MISTVMQMYDKRSRHAKGKSGRSAMNAHSVERPSGQHTRQSQNFDERRRDGSSYHRCPPISRFSSWSRRSGAKAPISTMGWIPDAACARTDGRASSADL